MRRLVSSELLKVRTTRSLFWTLIGAVLLVALVAIVQLAFVDDDELASKDSQLAVFGAAGAGTFFALVLGVLLVTNEYWHKTITHTFLVTPTREQVMLAKVVVSILGGLAYAIGTYGLTLAVGLTWLNLEGIAIAIGAGDAVREFTAIALGSMFYAVLGAGVAAIVRNQVAAVVGALVWFLIVEQTVVGLFPAVGKWTPSGAITSVGIALQDVEADVELLGPAAAAALIVAYVVAAVAAGTALVVRRDVS
jgi:ABC-type transport system involved in multi-copper enzyme maturation permease subunit